MKTWHVSFDDGCNIYHWIVFASTKQEAMKKTGCDKNPKALDGNMVAKELTQPITLIATEERFLDNIED